MANTPKARHSKTKRDPVTIDLDPVAVSPGRQAEEAPPAADEPDGGQPAAEDVAPPAADETDEAGFTRQGEHMEKDGPGEEGTAQATAANPPPRGRSAMPLLAGVAGGVVALLVAGGLQWSGVIPAPRVGDGEAAAIASLRQDIAGMESRLAGIAADADGVSASDLSALAGRVDGLESSLGTLQETVARLQDAPEPAAGAGTQALEERLARLEQQVRDSTQPVGAMDGLAERIGRLEQDVKAVEDGAGQAASNAGRLSELLSRVDALDGKIEARNEEPRVARLVAATALKSAVDRGVAFEGELQAYAALVPDAPDLDALRALAAEGVPTRTALAEAVPAVASRIVSAERIESDAGFLQRLWTSARALVVVRPVGEVAGDGVPAIAARLEADVRKGDYAAALAEYEKLPPEAKAAATAFAERLKARQAADGIMDQALSGALKAG